jgi:hypothetical protein
LLVRLGNFARDLPKNQGLGDYSPW